MSDLLDELRTVSRTGGDAYSSYEIVAMVRQAADEIERLRAAVDIALEAFRQIDRKSAEYLAVLNVHKQTEPEVMSKMFDYVLNGGDDLALANAMVEHISGYLGLEIDENARLRAALEQIATVCRDNAAATCNHAMALNFVEQIANAAAPQQPGAT